MTGNRYQELAMVTANKEMLAEEQAALVNGVLGLTGESGEIADAIKKSLFQGHTLDKHAIAKELGDVMWYIALTAHAIGYSLDAVMEMNIDKLKTRYPAGFEAFRSLNRED